MKALGWLARIFFLGATVLLLWPSLALNGTGILLFGALFIRQKMVGPAPSMPGEEANQSTLI